MTQTLEKAIYTAEATVKGGREGHGRTSDGVLDIDLARPGSGKPGTNPEQLFAIGYAACFQGALNVVGQRQKIDTTQATIDSAVSLGPIPGGRFGIAVALHVTIPDVDKDTAQKLVEAAHEVCPYSNATRGNIAVDLTVG
jgi:Ohr subfamily peroxiredoxin